MQQAVLLVQLLTLLAVANGTPVIASTVDAAFSRDCYISLLRGRAAPLSRLLQIEYPRSAVLSSRQMLEVMQRDLRWAVEAHRDD